MFRNNNCFCKLRKRIEKLESQLTQNFSGDSNLANTVQQIRNDLDKNTADDIITRGQVESLINPPDNNENNDDPNNNENPDNNDNSGNSDNPDNPENSENN